MKLPMEYLEALLAFSRADSIAEAAKTVGLSQPAMTRKLQTISELLPAEPFSMVGRRKTLTAYGRALVKVIESHLGGLDEDLAQLSLHFQDASRIQLRIGGRREILEVLSTKIKFPGTLILQGSTSEQLFDQLLRRSIDIAQALQNS